MLLKFCVLAFVLLNIVNGQEYVRVRRQGTKTAPRQPSPSYVQPQVKRPSPASSVSAGQRQRPRPAPLRPAEDEGQVNSAEGEAIPEPPIYGGVEGTPGVDFPAYTQIPRTDFKCRDYPYEPGMYADLDTQCQVYHVCFQGRKQSFLCGLGTVFNQAILACDYWHSVDCASTPNYYSVNEELGKANAEPGPGAPQPQRPQPQRPQPQPQRPQPILRPAIPSRPAPQPPQSPSIQRPEYQQPAVDEADEEPQQQPQQPPASQVRPAFPQRPRPQPPAPQPRPQPPPAKRPQPQPRPQYQPQPQFRPRPQPRPQQPEPQPQPQRPYPVPQPLPPRPAPRPQQPIGKPSPPRPPPVRPLQPVQRPIVQTRDEEPVDDSWLAGESPPSQRQESYYGY